VSWLTDPERRYRRLYKPLAFIACLVPLAWAVAGVLGLPVPGMPGLGPDPVRRVLGIFGHSALNLLLLTLAITPLRHLTGQARLLLLRRMLGLFAFTYALLHFVVYAGPFEGFSGAAVVKDIAKRPYTTIGFLALVLLVPLAVTSTNAMMRRLRRRWQSLHRLVYPIAILGVWHYWWQVKKDIREPLLYAALLALLLGWRVWRSWRAARMRAAHAPAPRAATSRSLPPTAPGTAAGAAPSPGRTPPPFHPSRACSQ
jgi:sulfoxide reductase heme-binding subunit YedZ